MDALLEEMKGLEDLDSARAFAKQRNVKTTKCKSVQDYKDRVKYDWMKKDGQMKDLKVAEHLMRKIHKEDLSRRNRLEFLYADLKSVMERIMEDSGLRKQLETEEVATSGDYKSTIVKFQQSLRQEHCPIVLAGETSSGKSSLLNLFIEDTVLPSKLVSCTSTACEIIYGESFEGALVIRKEDGSVDEKPFLYKDREKHIYKKTDRHDVFKHTVRLWVPLPFLQSGVTLVDTPGIGENNEMKQVLLDYVEQNQIYGFVYVIKSDNAGGVAEDRLQNLLSHLLKLQNEYGQKKVDPRTAIFICNRWDMVPDKEKASVEQDIIAKLSACWPGFDPKEQLFKMNTEFAFHTLKAGYITDDYSLLIDGIQKLLPMGLQHKLKMAYWWLDNVLTRLYHPIRVYLTRARQTTDQVLQKKELVENKVSSIQEECDRFVTDFHEKHRGSLDVISMSLLNHLELPAAATAMATWRRDDVPKEEYGDSWPIIEEKIDELIDGRVASTIGEWERQNRLMERNQKTMLTFISGRAESIADQLDDLEKMIRSTSLTEADKESRKDVKRSSELLAKAGSLDVPDELKKVEFFKDMKMLITENFGVSSVKQKIAMQNVIDAMFLSPAFLIDFKRKRRQKTAESMYELYKGDKVKFIADKATLVFQNIKTLNTVRQLVAMQLEALVEYVKDVQHKTPAVLKANQELLQAIMGDKRKMQDVERTYKPFEEEIRHLLNKSASFAYEAIKEYDISASSVTPRRPTSVKSPRKQRILLDGLFASYEVASLKQYKTSVVTIKKYHPRMSDSGKKQEESHLRFLLKEKLSTDYIPKLMMVMQVEGGLPALVFHGELESARSRYMPQNSMTAKVGRDYHFKDCNALIESLCRALRWLHIKHLVHMEVSLDSVMVDAGGGVKLSNLGEARTLELTEDAIDGPADSYVYMPPEVLNGERYSSASDMYSLGIFIWELWYDQQAFPEERMMSVREFRSIQTPFTRLKEAASCSSTHSIKGVVEDCMQPDAKKRLNMRKFEELWDKTMTHLNILRN